MRRSISLTPLIAVSLGAAMTLTACGGGDGGDPAPAAGGERGSGVLLATVGTPEDPEAFEIALTYEDGEPVTSLPAGDYTIEVSDPATEHNFHLTGQGVNEFTDVEAIVNVTWTVTLANARYTFVCDPHSTAMRGNFAAGTPPPPTPPPPGTAPPPGRCCPPVRRPRRGLR